VPARLVEVPEVPYTFSGKKVESAVRNLVNGKCVPNRDALSNPGSLDYYEEILPELRG
jgi:acetoacetyl-CoA synthetase